MISVELICLLLAGFVASLVQMFKGLAFVQRNTKWVALGLSVIISVMGELTLWNLDWQGIVACTLVPFLSSIGVYEVAKDTKKVVKQPLGTSL